MDCVVSRTDSGIVVYCKTTGLYFRFDSAGKSIQGSPPKYAIRAAKSFAKSRR